MFPFFYFSDQHWSPPPSTDLIKLFVIRYYCYQILLLSRSETDNKIWDLAEERYQQGQSMNQPLSIAHLQQHLNSSQSHSLFYLTDTVTAETTDVNTYRGQQRGKYLNRLKSGHSTTCWKSMQAFKFPSRLKLQQENLK